MAKDPLYIADGHHRYEAALAYRNERRLTDASISRDDPCNFVMMTLSSISDPGLIVRPFHRLSRGISELTLSKLLARLKEFFEVEEWSLDMPDVWQKVDSLLSHKNWSKTDDIVMVLFGLAREKLIAGGGGDFTTISKAMTASQSEFYKRIDVSIVEQFIIEKLLHITGETKETEVGWVQKKR